MKNNSKGGRRKAEGGSAELHGGRASCAAWFFLLVFILHPSSFILSTASAQQAKPAGTPAAADTTPRGPLTYDSFKLIHTRNVFDPDRRPVRPSNASTAVPTGRSDYLALTGTLLDADKTYAFFSGSRTEFNKVLTVGDKIANAKVTRITPVDIVVERDGRPTTVRVGQTVPLDGKSAPGAPPVNVTDVTTTTTSTERPAAAPGDAAPGTVATAPGSAGPGGKPPAGSKEEIMRKMMERRQQDLK